MTAETNIFESGTEIVIFVGDGSYDNSSWQRFGLGEIWASNVYGALLCMRYGRLFKKRSLAGGADWPGFVAQIANFAPVALFFLGKPIDENLDAWAKLFGKFSSLKKKGPFQVQSNGAAMLALKFLRDHARVSESDVVLVQYEIVDGRTKDEAMAWFTYRPGDGRYRPDYWIAGSIYMFYIAARGKLYKIKVDRSDVSIVSERVIE